MLDSNLKIRIYSQPWDGATHIALMVQKNGQWNIAKPVSFDFVPISPGEQTPATMTFAPEVATEFLNAMAQALDDRGIKPPNDHHVAGKLEATQHHLEDMRGLLAWFTQQDTGESHGH